MPSEFPMNDPRNIWQNQPTEPFKMSADELRRKAQQRQRKARFENRRTHPFRILRAGLRPTPRGGAAHGGGPAKFLGHLLCVSGIQMDLAGTANAGCDAQYHAPVVQKRTREAARLWPARLAQGGSHVRCLGRGDGYSAGADQVAGHPTAPSGPLAILCPSRDMACSFPSLEEAESGQASTGDRRVTRV